MNKFIKEEIDYNIVTSDIIFEQNVKESHFTF